jgi:hypothetical protein
MLRIIFEIIDINDMFFLFCFEDDDEKSYQHFQKNKLIFGQKQAKIASFFHIYY